MGFKGMATGLLVTLLISACNDGGGYPNAISSENTLKHVSIIAHRGGMAYAPENTVQAFKNAARLPVDIVELDVQVVEQDVFVLHDFSLDRTTDCQIVLIAMDAGMREVCDAGYWWRPGDNLRSSGVGRTFFRSLGLRIPLLQEVFEAVRDSDLELMIELKYRYTPGDRTTLGTAISRLVLLVLDSGLSDRIWIESSSPSVLATFEGSVPWIRTVLVWGKSQPISCHEAVIEAVIHGIDSIALQASHATDQEFASCAEAAVNAGILLVFWVVNNAGDVEELLQLAPDGIMTDFPACVGALLRDVRVPNPYPDVVTRGQLRPKCDYVSSLTE